MPLIQPKFSEIEKRRSVRTFVSDPMNDVTRSTLKRNLDAISTECGPFSHSIRLVLLDHHVDGDRNKLGTYGIIKGAQHYIAGAVTSGETALIDFGYLFEKAVLVSTALQMGTCWLGGTFNRSEFAQALNLSRDELLPCVSPIGIQKQIPSLTDRIMRKLSNGNNRKNLGAIAYVNSFSTEATKASLGNYYQAVEAVRLAPSASNKQPWKIMMHGGNLHLYLNRTQGYSKSLGFDIQLIDIGIAMYHVEIAERELNHSGRWIVLTDPPGEGLFEYIATWSTTER